MFTVQSPYNADENSLINATSEYSRLFRVGDNAVLTNGAYIAGYDDDGVVFAARHYADDSGLGLGRLTTFHVHDNQDGTMEVYYQVRDADPLPTLVSNWRVRLDAETGAEIAPAAEITTGVFSRSNQGMLEAAFDLPNGNIAVVQAASTFTTGELLITDADGTFIGGSGNVLPARIATFNLTRGYDLTVVGDQIALAFGTHNGGGAREAFVQMFNMDGTVQGDVITVSDAESSIFGVSVGVQIETLANGQFVVVWTDGATQTADSSQGSVWFKIFNADGSLAVDSTLVNTNTAGNQTTPSLVATETGFLVGYYAFEFSPSFANESRIQEFDLAGNRVGTVQAGLPTADQLLRIDNNSALLIGVQVREIDLDGAEGSLDSAQPVNSTGTSGADLLEGTSAADTLTGLAGNDTLLGLDGTDSLDGGDGDDSLNGGGGDDTMDGGTGNDTMDGGAGDDQIVNSGGGRDLFIGGAGSDTLVTDVTGLVADFDLLFDATQGLHGRLGSDLGQDTISGIENFEMSGLWNARLVGDDNNNRLQAGAGNDTLIGGGGDDTLIGGTSETDLRDVIYGGEGNDSIDGGYGNDELRGDAGNDTLAGNYGADTVIGGAGDDVLTGSAWGDDLFGGDGMDFVNGGFGHDRVNGGAGGDRFFHIGVEGHGSDWIQDYVAADGDVLQFGGTATRDQFQVNLTETASAGEVGVEEAFVIYRPTGQILWALIDGGGQAEINLLLAGVTYDLMA